MKSLPAPAAIFKMNMRVMDPSEMKRERRRRQRQQCWNCIKATVAFLFSHIGLAFMVVGYSIIGGFLFKALEAPHEVAQKLYIVKYKEDKIEEIWKYAAQLDIETIDKGNFTEEIARIFYGFQREVHKLVKEQGWDGEDSTDETRLQWSFAGALLYAITVITTIGYGHIAPKTPWGRLITILYALVGIPLTFLYLSNMGNFMAEGFRVFYKRICCDLCCCQKCERNKRRERQKRREMARREQAMQRNSFNRKTIRKHTRSDVALNSPSSSDNANLTVVDETMENPECQSLNDSTDAEPIEDEESSPSIDAEDEDEEYPPSESPASTPPSSPAITPELSPVLPRVPSTPSSIFTQSSAAPSTPISPLLTPSTPGSPFVYGQTYSPASPHLDDLREEPAILDEAFCDGLRETDILGDDEEDLYMYRQVPWVQTPDGQMILDNWENLMDARETDIIDDDDEYEAYLQGVAQHIQQQRQLNLAREGSLLEEDDEFLSLQGQSGIDPGASSIQKGSSKDPNINSDRKHKFRTSLKDRKRKSPSVESDKPRETNKKDKSKSRDKRELDKSKPSRDSNESKDCDKKTKSKDRSGKEKDVDNKISADCGDGPEDKKGKHGSIGRDKSKDSKTKIKSRDTSDKNKTRAKLRSAILAQHNTEKSHDKGVRDSSDKSRSRDTSDRDKSKDSKDRSKSKDKKDSLGRSKSARELSHIVGNSLDSREGRSRTKSSRGRLGSDGKLQIDDKSKLRTLTPDVSKHRKEKESSSKEKDKPKLKVNRKALLRSAIIDHHNKDSSTDKTNSLKSKDKDKSKKEDRTKDKSKERDKSNDKNKTNDSSKDRNKSKDSSKERDKSKSKEREQSNKRDKKTKDSTISSDRSTSDRTRNRDTISTLGLDTGQTSPVPARTQSLQRSRSKDHSVPRRGSFRSSTTGRSSSSKRGGTKRWRMSNRRNRSASDEETRNLTEDNRGCYGSDCESFVTAHSDSFMDEMMHNNAGPSSGDDEENIGMPLQVKFNHSDDPYGNDAVDLDVVEYEADAVPYGFIEPFEIAEDEEKSEKVRVPVSICLIIITGYIVGGAVLFTLWEQWDLLTGSYFCFITLSTIGFGDIVPGTDSLYGSHQQLILCAFWLAFGLSLLAMCFNLMQEEVAENCKWLGRKIGLLKEDDA